MFKWGEYKSFCADTYQEFLRYHYSVICQKCLKFGQILIHTHFYHIFTLMHPQQNLWFTNLLYNNMLPRQTVRRREPVKKITGIHHSEWRTDQRWHQPNQMRDMPLNKEDNSSYFEYASYLQPQGAVIIPLVTITPFGVQL